MDFSKIKKATETVEGFLSDAEGKTLYTLAKEHSGKGTIVEIGSWKGKSTIWLANGSRDGGKARIVAIDPHTGSPEHGRVNTLQEFKRNIKQAKVKDIVTTIVKTSEQASKDFKEKVGLLFIDGNHDYDFVKTDFKVWEPKVVEHGAIAFHDSHLWGGPKKVVREFVASSNRFRNIKFVDSITYAEKVRQNSFGDRMKNRYVMLLGDVFALVGAFNLKFPLPRSVKALGKKIVLFIQ